MWTITTHWPHGFTWCFFFIFQTARMNMMIYIALPSIPLSDCIEYKNHRNHRNIHIFHRFTFLFFPFSIHFEIRPLSFKFPEQSNYYNNQSLIDRCVFFLLLCLQNSEANFITNVRKFDNKKYAYQKIRFTTSRDISIS